MELRQGGRGMVGRKLASERHTAVRSTQSPQAKVDAVTAMVRIGAQIGVGMVILALLFRRERQNGGCECENGGRGETHFE